MDSCIGLLQIRNLPRNAWEACRFVLAECHTIRIKKFRFGGSGTTATTFIYLLWAVLPRRDIVERLEEELQSAFPDAQVIPDSIVSRASRSMGSIFH